MHRRPVGADVAAIAALRLRHHRRLALLAGRGRGEAIVDLDRLLLLRRAAHLRADGQRHQQEGEEGERSEEHTSELQSLMRISYAVFCLKKKTKSKHKRTT